ncbi:Ribosome-associated, Iojap [Nannochloropsis gaditana]|uniref:Ribosome-associated, Iojap n=1 Tax=Nannochloropsis gaditana TaxID=72520 RepID=W7U178_9STRA|nr:Ribosome-associated, Iojap [Nannochloropsis gaditana]
MLSFSRTRTASQRRIDGDISPPITTFTTSVLLFLLALYPAPETSAFFLPSPICQSPASYIDRTGSAWSLVSPRPQSSLYSSESNNTPQRPKQKKGGREGYNRNRRREEALDGMKVGHRFEMGYDIEEETVPLAEDETLPVIETIASAADMRKGEDVLALRVSRLTTVSSFFVLVSGNSRPQIQAIAGAIEEDMLEKHGLEVRNGGEGTADSGWILLDYGSVVVNVMTPVARKFYALEKLWKNGEEVDLSHILRPNLPPGSEGGREGGREGDGPGPDPSLMEDAFWS